MVRNTLRFALPAVFLILSSAPGLAQAQKVPRKPSQEGDTEQPKPVDTSDAPEPDKSSEFAVPKPAQSVSETVEEEARPKDLFYGAGLRGRWVSVPSWMLGLFTKKNVPLSSYSAGVELFRRKGDMDFVLGFSYQNMSPPDGNWLGKTNDATIDTDFVQFRNFGFVGVDMAFVWHNLINEYVGFHYGAGLGVAIVTGEMLRTSAANCVEANVGNLSQCHPQNVQCDANGCSEVDLTRLGPGKDDYNDPHRFKDPNVPPIIPIINVVLGIDLHLPKYKGFEVRLEGGFYDAFFAGGAASYAF